MTDQPKPEIWNPVVGYQGLYEVSDQGRVRSLDRVLCDGRRYKGRILKTTGNQQGYPTVGLWMGGKVRTVKVHRLVASAFIPPGRPDQNDVNHRDGVKTNNAVGNLEWASRAENVQHAYDTGLSANAGQSHHNAKLTEAQAAEIQRLAREGSTLQKDIANQFGICRQQVSRIKLGKDWTKTAGAES